MMSTAVAAERCSGRDRRATLDALSHSIAQHYQFCTSRAGWSSFLNEDARGRDLFNDVESQKCFSNDNFVAIAQCLTLSGRHSLSSVDKSTICGAKVLQEILPIA